MVVIIFCKFRNFNIIIISFYEKFMHIYKLNIFRIFAVTI